MNWKIESAFFAELIMLLRCSVPLACLPSNPLVLIVLAAFTYSRTLPWEAKTLYIKLHPGASFNNQATL